MVAKQNIWRLDALHADLGDLAVMDQATNRGKAVDQRLDKLVLRRCGLGHVKLLGCGRTASGVTSVSHHNGNTFQVIYTSGLWQENAENNLLQVIVYPMIIQFVAFIFLI